MGARTQGGLKSTIALGAELPYHFVLRLKTVDDLRMRPHDLLRTATRRDAVPIHAKLAGIA